MKILETQMSLPDRMVAEASVAQLEEAEQPKYGMLATTVAAIESTSTTKLHIPFLNDSEQKSVIADENFDPLSYVPKDMINSGKLDYAWDEIMKSTNQAEVMGIVQSANAEAQRKNIMANGSGWGNFWGTAIGIMSSPEYWPGLLWNPTGGMVRTGIELGLIAGAETATHEYTLQQNQVNRDPYESLANVGTAALFGSVIGFGIGKFMKPEVANIKNPAKNAADEIGREVNDISHNGAYRNVEDLPDEIPVEVPNMRSAGAAETGLGEAAKPIRELRWGSGYISLMRPLVKARVAEVHDVLNKYFGHDFQIKANAKEVEVWDATQGKMVKTGQKEHVAKETSLARRVDRESNSMIVAANKSLMKSYMDYVGYQGKSFTLARLKNIGTWDEFNRKVRYAVSNNDMAENPADVAVTQAAKELRRTVYDPIQKLARELEMLDKEAKDQLKNNLQKITERLNKSEDPVEIQKLTDDLQKAQKELDDFDERIGDVKFADSYANRRLHRENIENNADTFKNLLRTRYKELREETALKTFKDIRAEKIAKARELNVKRLAKLAKSGAKNIQNDATILKRERQIAKLQHEMDTATIDDFRIRDTETLAEIEANVNSSYQRVLNGEVVGEIWQKGAHQPKVFKERELPLTDNELLAHGFLHTNMLDQVRAYLNGTLRPLRMKEVAGDTEMTQQLRNVEAKYDIDIAKARKAGKADLAKDLDREKTLNIEALALARDRYYDRSAMYQGRAASLANYGRAIRNFNVIRMMGGVLTTSLNDVARLNAARIFSKAMHGKSPGLLAAFRTLKNGTTKEALSAAGFAAETTNMLRLTKLVDMGVPLITGSQKSKKFLNMTAIAAKSLMKATLLTQWTDYMKMMAAAMTQNQTIYLMKNYAKLKVKEKTILAEMGIDESFAKQVIGQFDQFGESYGKYATSLNWDDWTDRVAAERMKDIMFRQSERILVTPRETDLPAVIADNELGRAFLQFKSFSLAAHNQTTVPLLERAQTGDLMSLYALAGMSIGAVPTEMIKMWEAGREDELANYTAADWGLAIADRSAIAPLLSMGFNMIDMTSGNRITHEFGANPPSRYSDRTALGSFGPSFSTIGDMMRLSAGMAGDGLDNRDARAMRRLLPFQNYMLLNRLANKILPNQSRKASDGKYREQ